MHMASDVLSFLMTGGLVIVLLLMDEQPGSSTKRPSRPGSPESGK